MRHGGRPDAVCSRKRCAQLLWPWQGLLLLLLPCLLTSAHLLTTVHFQDCDHRPRQPRGHQCVSAVNLDMLQPAEGKPLPCTFIASHAGLPCGAVLLPP